MYSLLSIKKSTKKDKKLTATFKNKKTSRLKTVNFGSKGYSDYTIHKDPKRKKRYISRHKSRENFKDYTSRGSLSRYILWNKPSVRSSIIDYKKRFNL
jgi:hypothetical protein